MINVVYDSMYQYGTMDNQWLYGSRGDLWTSLTGMSVGCTCGGSLRPEGLRSLDSQYRSSLCILLTPRSSSLAGIRHLFRLYLAGLPVSGYLWGTC